MDTNKQEEKKKFSQNAQERSELIWYESDLKPFHGCK